jgi:hypothetical protein
VRRVAIVAVRASSAFADRALAYFDDERRSYLRRRGYGDPREFAEIVVRALRSPRGRGTTILQTQAARLGGRQGVEAAIMRQVVPFSLLGPTMRVFGIELESGEVALVTFAAENPSYHNVFFGWVKKSIAWRGSAS